MPRMSPDPGRGGARRKPRRSFDVALELPSEAATADELAPTASAVLFLDRVRATGVEFELDAANVPAVTAI